MSRTLEPPMTIRILLPEDSKESKVKKSTTIRHCGDSVEGVLEVIIAGDSAFQIDVSFEGTVRTWIRSKVGSDSGHLPQTAEFQFLRQTQNISSDSSTRCCKNNVYIYRLPFQFIIPHELIPHQSGVYTDFLQLCPSTKLGALYLGTATRKTYKQPSITYMLRIIRAKTDIVVPSPIRCYDEREITVVPYTAAAPPIEVGNFPHEYILYTTTKLKQHMWKHAPGLIHVVAEEPPPLNTLIADPRTSTLVSIQLNFIPNKPYEMKEDPHGWKLLAKYCLRSRTFYSTLHLDRVPSAFDIRTASGLRMHEEKTSWKVRHFGGLDWRKYGSENDSDLLQVVRWTTSLFLPVSAAKDLLPTFVNILSARQYSLMIRLTIEGHHHGVIELAIPVQVINYPAQAALLAVQPGAELSEDCNPSWLNPISIESTILYEDGDLEPEEQANFPPPYDVI